MSVRSSSPADLAASAAAPVVIKLLADLVEERTGLHYDVGDRPVFVEKITQRALGAGYESLLDYYYLLRYDPAAAAELRELTDALVVGETYFFRELAPLELIVDRLLGPAIAAGRRPRVWSAACSTGEEPLTLAMLLDERGWLPAVELIASDISVRSLEQARSGRFGRRALRGPNRSAVAGRLREETDGSVTVAPALVAAVDWRRINLCDAAEVGAVGRCDVILCRNAMIYFRETTVRRVVDRLAASLVPGGALFVGISESLLRFGTSLTCEEDAGVFFYRKPR
jgi:chemotaxis protein methyltransferase CheR